MTRTPDYIRISEAPATFSVSQQTLRRWAKAGHIHLYKHGHLALVKTVEVAAYIEGRPSES